MTLSRSTKGQVWYTDFVIGVIILLAMVVVFFINMHNLEESRNEGANVLVKEGTIITDSLMSSGLPRGWTNDTVIQLGVVDNQRVNTTQLSALLQVPYESQRRLLRTTAEYAFFFEQKDGCIVLHNGTRVFGSPEIVAQNGSCVTRNQIDTSVASSLIPITRYVLFGSSPVRMVTYVWD